MEGRAHLEIEGQRVEVVSLTGREGLSSLFRYEVRAEPGEGAAPPREWVGRPARVIVDDGLGALHGSSTRGRREVTGVVGRAVRRVFDTGAMYLDLVIVPRVFSLSLGQTFKTFIDASVVDVAREILGKTRAPVRYELGGTYDPVAHQVQFRESDWAFLSRLLEEDGIFTWFDLEGGETTLVVSDDGRACPPIVGERVRYAAEAGMRADRDLVTEVVTTRAAAPTKFAIRSFDPARPAFRPQADEGDGEHVHYDAPGAGPTSAATTTRRARVRREAAASSANVVTGSATSLRLAPGRVLELEGHPLHGHDGRYLLTSVEVRAARGTGEGGQGYVANVAFTAQPADLPYRSPLVTPRPRKGGIQPAQVVGPAGQEIHPDASGRIRAQLHWDREGQKNELSGTYMRVGQRPTSDSMLLPRMGWNVLTTGEEGSPDVPGILGRIFDAEHPPPYALPDEATKNTYKTATSPGGGSFNEIQLESKAGGEKMTLAASGNMNTLVGNDEVVNVAANTVRTVGADAYVAVGAALGEFIGASDSWAIGGNQAVKVAAKQALGVVANASETIAGKRALGSGRTVEQKVDGTRTLGVATAMIDATLGPIKTGATTSKIVVGGAMVRLTPMKIIESVKLASAQTIGGAKIELARVSRVISVKGRLMETVGALMKLHSADSVKIEGVDAHDIQGGTEAELSAPTVTVTGKQKIVIESGASSITITAGSVAIQAPKIDTSGATITSKAKVALLG